MKKELLIRSISKGPENIHLLTQQVFNRLKGTMTL